MPACCGSVPHSGLQAVHLRKPSLYRTSGYCQKALRIACRSCPMLFPNPDAFDKTVVRRSFPAGGSAISGFREELSLRSSDALPSYAAKLFSCVRALAIRFPQTAACFFFHLRHIVFGLKIVIFATGRPLILIWL